MKELAQAEMKNRDDPNRVYFLKRIFFRVNPKVRILEKIAVLFKKERKNF